MKAVELSRNVFRVSADIGSRDLFEGIWPIPNGVSLNSYVVKGRVHTVLIDLVKDWEGAAAKIVEQMDGSDRGISLAEIDYLVLNHLEPDHTGWLREMHRLRPDVKVLCTKKGAALVQAFYGFSDNVQIVKNGDVLDLGDRTLVFYETPNIHWPETMMTYDTESKILFSCDAFGAFGQVGETIFDDQLSPERFAEMEYEMLRYYANIVSTFSQFVMRGIDKLSGLEIRMIAPSHGVIWRKDPGKVVDMYVKLASYMDGPAEPEITIVWSSMYGNTQQLLDSVVAGVESEGLKVHVHRVPQEHVSFVLASAWRSSGIIIGTPTYEYRMFPPMYAVLDVLERSHVKNRKAMRFGSYGWSGGANKQYDELTSLMKWDCLGVVEFQGAPTEEDKATAFEMARGVARSVMEWISGSAITTQGN